ncbi:MAG: bifunctional folylpolyglutamate synthase/ dihydrofolate synthase [Desulfovibrio sp.]|nr:bifunctional folylpolyglutamate synthase/ dihydrofolate synthase [Desulfovibrio sp.]
MREQTSFFDTGADVVRHLESLGLFHVDLGLARMQRALVGLGLTSPPYVTVQVLGTNGKGSTAAFLASLAQSCGCRTGLYTSPHFVSPTERIRIGEPGRDVLLPWPLERWTQAANAVMTAAPDLTYFEFLTALALRIFQQEGVELAVLEAGLGGRHDATSAAPAHCLCYGPIAMDHSDVLGPTLADIATDKAAAIRSPAPVCTIPQFPVAAAALVSAAYQQQAELVQARHVAADVSLGLAGPHQRANAGLALTAWGKVAPLLGRDSQDWALLARGLSRAFLPGRLQRVASSAQYPPLLLDGAHNPHGMTALIAAMRAQGVRPAGVVFSCLGDKDWRPGLRMLRTYTGTVPYVAVPLDNPRAALIEDMVAACNAVQPATAVALPKGGNALNELLLKARAWPEISPARPLLITGSLYLLSEIFALHPRLLLPDARA